MFLIEQWFKSYYQMLVAYAWKMVKEEEIAHEIVQELFLTLSEKQDSLSISKSPKSYLFQAVHNRCINYLKKAKKQQSVSLDQVPPGLSRFSDPIEMAELHALLSQWIQRLPPVCQQVFRMSRFEDKTNREIGEELGISKRTVDAHINKALKILKKQLKTSYYQDPSRSRLLCLLL